MTRPDPHPWPLPTLAADLWANDLADDLPLDSPALGATVTIARRAAASTAPILVVGEPGTGKAQLARMIHAWSPRAGRPLATVDVAGDDADAVDAELVRQLDRCDGGTLVLRRVGRLPLPLQMRVARLIAERRYERNDGVDSRPADVRVIATAEDDLDALVAAGRFREPLRLAVDVVRVELPPLRARPADVATLAGRAVARAARRYGRAVAGLSADAMVVLTRHPWPGNGGELAAVVERAVVVCRGDRVDVCDLPPDLPVDRAGGHRAGDLVPLRTIADQHIRGVLAAVGSPRAAAAVLGVAPSTVSRRLRPPAGPSAGPPAEPS